MASAPWLWTESRGSRLRGWKPGAVGQPLPGGGQRPGSTEMLCKELNQQPPSPSRPGNCTGFQEMQTNASSPGSGLCLLSASFALQTHKIPRRWHRGTVPTRIQAPCSKAMPEAISAGPVQEICSAPLGTASGARGAPRGRGVRRDLSQHRASLFFILFFYLYSYILQNALMQFRHSPNPVSRDCL